MRKLTIILAVITITSVFAVSQLQRLSVDMSLSDWHQNMAGYQTALSLQKQNGKPIALFFHTDWCASCKQLTANVLGQKTVNDFLQGFIPVKINPETSAEEEQLAKQYNVLGYPTFLIKKASSENIIRIPVNSRTEPQQFVQWCDRATSGMSAL